MGAEDASATPTCLTSPSDSQLVGARQVWRLVGPPLSYESWQQLAHSSVGGKSHHHGWVAGASWAAHCPPQLKYEQCRRRGQEQRREPTKSAESAEDFGGHGRIERVERGRLTYRTDASGSMRGRTFTAS